MASKNKEPSQETLNYNLMKREALKKIVEHNRDYLKLDVTIPLGNTALKQVHTNQWLWTDLPKKFDLANWTVLAKALNSNVNRFEGYVKNRWYIESVDINVDVTGKAEMKLGLNAFASSYKGYADGMRSIEKAYNDAVNKQDTNTGKKSSASKSTSNAVATGELIKQDWVKRYNISGKIVDKVKSICKQGATDYNNVRAIFKWMDDNLPYEGYGNTRYGAVGIMEHGKGNCCDHAHLFCAMCRCLGVKCNYIHNPCCGDNGHVYNIVYLDGKGIIVDTGRDNASWGSHWGNSGCPTEKTSIDF